MADPRPTEIDHSTEPCAGYLFASVPGERERAVRKALNDPVLMLQRPDLRARAIQAFNELHPRGTS